MPVTCALDGSVAVLTMDQGRGNAIDHTFIDALGGALAEALAGPARAAVLTGAGRTFCAGLDLVTSSAFDRPAMERYVDAFEALFLRVATFARPLVAAVNGHALAGGCILAMAADYRIMATGPYAIGINEVLVGIPFPAGAFEIARHALPPAAWAEGFLEGRRFSPEEALGVGLVHRLVPPERLVAEAVDKARLLSAGADDAIRDTKADLLAPMVARVEAGREARRARFLERWFAPEARARIAGIVGGIGRKRAPSS